MNFILRLAEERERESGPYKGETSPTHSETPTTYFSSTPFLSMTDPRHMAVAPKHVIPLLLLQTSGSIWGDPVYMSLLIALKVECEDG